MTIDGFDYKNLANTFAEQAFELVPEDISKKNTQYIKNIIGNFSLLAGEAIFNQFDEKKATFLVQLVAEWSFHKALDLTKSKIPEQYWDAVLQKVAFTVFEITKQCFKKDIPQGDILALVEYHVDIQYKDALKDLFANGEITEDVLDHALNLSYIDEMAKNFVAKENTSVQETKNYTGDKSETNIKEKINEYGWIVAMLWTIFIITLVSSLVINILDNLNFPIQPWIVVGLVMFAVAYLLSVLVNRDVQNQLEQLEEVRQNMQDLVDPNKMYERFGVDILKIWVGEGLLPISDPDQEGQLLPKVAALRQNLTDSIGYVIPNIRLQDEPGLLPNQYKILVRDKEVATGFVYPNKVMVKVDICDEQGIDIQDNSVIAVNYKDEKVVWLDKNILPDGVKYYSPEDSIIEHLKFICFEYADKIISISDVEKLINLVASNSEKLSYEVLYCINIFQLKIILVNLIKDMVSIKDIVLVFEKIAEYSHLDSDIDFITEKVKQVLLDS